MQREQLLGQVQANAKPVFGRSRATRQLRESLEHSGNLLVEKADAVINDPKQSLIALSANLDPHPAIDSRELQGVVEQVFDDLRDPDRVDIDHQLAIGQRNLQAPPPCLRDQPIRIGGSACDLNQVGPLELHLQASGRDSRDIKQVIDQSGHMRHLSLEDRHDRTCHSGHVDRSQKLERIADRCQRVAQFVGQHRQEILLATIGLINRDFGQALPGDIKRRANQALYPPLIVTLRRHRGLDKSRAPSLGHLVEPPPADTTVEHRLLERHQRLRNLGAKRTLVVTLADQRLGQEIGGMNPGETQRPVHGEERHPACGKGHLQALRRGAQVVSRLLSRADIGAHTNDLLIPGRRIDGTQEQ